MDGLLLGLAGPARCGKSSAAEILRFHHGLPVRSFATPIRRMLSAALDWDASHFDGVRKESVDSRYGFSPREAMQTLGDWGRDRNSRLWIRLVDESLDHLRRRIIADGERWRGAVFADVRFENEAAWVRARGGIVLHISRKGTPAVCDHVSEEGIRFRPGDLPLTNSGTLEELQARISGALFHLQGCRAS